MVSAQKNASYYYDSSFSVNYLVRIAKLTLGYHVFVLVFALAHDDCDDMSICCDID